MEPTKSKKFNFLNGLNVCLLFAVVVSGFYYLKSMDDLVSKNFELQNLKERKILLEEENKNYEVLKNDLESYESMNLRIEELKMVKVTGVKYISLDDDSLAKK